MEGGGTSPPPPPNIMDAAAAALEAEQDEAEEEEEDPTARNDAVAVAAADHPEEEDVTNPTPLQKTPRKKSEILDVPRGEPTCSECGKVFKSWKAVFGHLRVHPSRPFRGAFPPPVAEKSGQSQSPRLGLHVDLNVEGNEEEEEEEDEEVEERRKRIKKDLDLNQPPSSPGTLED